MLPGEKAPILLLSGMEAAGAAWEAGRTSPLILWYLTAKEICMPEGRLVQPEGKQPKKFMVGFCHVKQAVSLYF